MLLSGNCLEQLKKLEDNSIDSIVTDPPYGLSFMGKKWDYDVPSIAIWRECLRVLKPGGHLLSFGGTRTYHRLVVNIEDAGFEIRDCIQWLYGSGFPKSTDVSKRIDKEAGAEREVIGVAGKSGSIRNSMAGDFTGGEYMSTAPATDAAKQWQGWGTALKPANEPICVARKPLEKGLTVAENVQKWGTGAINIDASRIGYLSEADKKNNTEALARFNSTSGDSGAFMTSKSIQPNLAGTSLGRWPANIILDEEAAKVLDEQSGTLKSGKPGVRRKAHDTNATSGRLNLTNETEVGFGDSGGASRFFYVAKASKAERNRGLEGMPEKKTGDFRRGGAGNTRSSENYSSMQNHHPTVKPIKLMEYLIKLVTPPNGTVLDPFMGSGSTGVAAKKLGFKFVGCELNEEYLEIANKRIQGV